MSAMRAVPVPTVREGIGAGYPLVAGYCPGCGGSSLFLGAGGHVTCARLDCSAPSAADRLLDPKGFRA